MCSLPACPMRDFSAIRIKLDMSDNRIRSWAYDVAVCATRLAAND